MISKPFDEIGKGEIDALLSDRVAEQRTIEYKLELPGNTDADKKEFLADVSSLANAAGGILLCGVSAKDGIPLDIPGVACAGRDKEALRVEEMIRTGIAPRIPGVRTKWIDGYPKGPVFMVHMPRSWSSPHMVTYKGTSRFYTRDSAGKHQLDVAEIRAAFLLSEAVPDRMRRFREERLSKIISGETPVPMCSGAKIALHLLPVSAFSTAARIDITAVVRGVCHLCPMQGHSWDSKMNLDGCVSYAPQAPVVWPDGLPPTKEARPAHWQYSQLFRSGAIEAVNGFLLYKSQGRGHVPRTYEETLVRALKSYLDLLTKLEVDPPLFVFLGMLGVKGFTMASDARDFLQALHTMDRDDLLLPEVVLEDFHAPPEQILKPIFDAVWQCAGHLRSYNYDEAGKWAPA